MRIASLFSGAGGLDKGFERANFHVTWANEYDPTIWETFHHNFPKVLLDKRSITQVKSEDVPEIEGIIGGGRLQQKGLKN